MIRDLQVAAGMPPRTVQDQNEFTIGSGPGLFGKGGQFDGERLRVDGGGGLPERAPGLRVDEADQRAPLVAGLHRNDRALSGQCPDLPQDRLYANAMLVGRPDLNARLRMRGLDGLNGIA